MTTSHGVIQGYDGVTAVDAKHQVVAHAAAFGEAQEHDLLRPMIEATRELPSKRRRRKRLRAHSA